MRSLTKEMQYSLPHIPDTIQDSISVKCIKVENVKPLLEVERSVPLQQQQLLYNGKEMENFENLSALGVKDEDLAMMISAAASRKALMKIGPLPWNITQKLLQGWFLMRTLGKTRDWE